MGLASIVLFVASIGVCGFSLWRRTRSEMGVCMALRDVKSIQQLRTTFQEGLPSSHVAAFIGGWLVKPEHTAAHGKLLQLLKRRSVKLDRPKPWIAATGLARLRLAEADDILPVLLGESGTLDLFCKDAHLVVRFRVLPRGRETLRARLFSPRPTVLLRPSKPKSLSHGRIWAGSAARAGARAATHLGVSPPQLAISTRRPRLTMEGADGSQSLQQSFTMRVLTVEKIGREVEVYDVGKNHRLPTPRFDCSRQSLRVVDLTEGEIRLPGDTSGEIDYADMRLPGDTDAVAEMLFATALNEALFLRSMPTALDAADEGLITDAKDAVAKEVVVKDAKDAVAPEAGQAVVHGYGGGLSGVAANSAPPQRVGLSKVLSWALLPAAPRLRKTWSRRVQPSEMYQR